MRILADFASALADAIAPPLCVLCRAPSGTLPWLCADCAGELRLELERWGLWAEYEDRFLELFRGR